MAEAKSAHEHAQEHAKKQEEASKEMEEFEKKDEVPKDPNDWPDGKAKYITYGLSDDSAYGEGTTGKLGPADVVHEEDGSVTVGGEKVDNPEEFKGGEIKGGVMEQIEEGKRSYSDDDDGEDSSSGDKES